jgi:hypothetical protein
MAHEIQWPLDGWLSFTITVNALGIGAARQSTLLTNTTNRPRALVFPRLQPSAATTAGTIYEAFLIRGDGTNRTDGAGASDAAFTVHNAQLIGTIANDTGAGAGTFFADVFDTAPMGLLGSEWGVAIRNSTNVALNAANNTVKYNLGVQSLQ